MNVIREFTTTQSNYKSNLVFQIVFILLLLICTINSTIQAHETIEEAKAAKHVHIKKYYKKLQKQDGAIRLIGGRSEYEGNIEILHNGKWGNICDDEWDQNEAEVVCRQLGFTSGSAKITHSAWFGEARRRYWMDNVLCDGNETEISQCRFNGWGDNDCEASEAAGIICHNPNEKPDLIRKNRKKRPKLKFGSKYEMEIRLTGGRNPNEGQVEVRFNKVHKKGHWGAICGDGWSLLEANVVCKSLDLGYASHALQTDIFSENKLLRTLISGTECYGNETGLNDCLHHQLGEVVCPGREEHVAAVICTKEIADLVFDADELQQSAHLEDRPLFLLQCAMEENCLASRAYQIQRDDPNWQMISRRLLKFTARVLNAGTADFRPSIPKNLWEWHLCHQHYHSMEVFATFNIYDHVGHKVAEGHKASFCLEDNQCMPGVQPRYACANYGDQGITVNCSDIYRYNIDCQWVDITEMTVGTYTIKISVNPEFKVGEMSYENNAARCTLLYTETFARIFDCEMERP